MPRTTLAAVALYQLNIWKKVVTKHARIFGKFIIHFLEIPF